MKVSIKLISALKVLKFSEVTKFKHIKGFILPNASTCECQSIDIIEIIFRNGEVLLKLFVL